MRRLVLVLVFILAGCSSGPSDAARAWCNDHPVDVRLAGALHNTSDWNQSCVYAFNH